MSGMRHDFYITAQVDGEDRLPDSFRRWGTLDETQAYCEGLADGLNGQDVHRVEVTAESGDLKTGCTIVGPDNISNIDHRPRKA